MPKPPEFKVDWPDGALPTLFWVLDLIDSANHSWKSDLLTDLFSTHDRGFIANIHLARKSTVDHLIWRHASKGVLALQCAQLIGLQWALVPNFLLVKKIEVRCGHIFGLFVWHAK